MTRTTFLTLVREFLQCQNIFFSYGTCWYLKNKLRASHIMIWLGNAFALSLLRSAGDFHPGLLRYYPRVDPMAMNAAPRRRE